MHNANLMQILRHENIQKILQKPKLGRVHSMTKRNPLRNIKVLLKLNPYAKVEKAVARKQQIKSVRSRKVILDAKIKEAADKKGPAPTKAERRKTLRAIYKSTPELARKKEIAKVHRRDQSFKNARLAKLRREKIRSDRKSKKVPRKPKKYLGKNKKPLKAKTAKSGDKSKKVPAAGGKAGAKAGAKAGTKKAADKK
uniref:60S ribosomal protein L4-A-like n=1 Tax=Hirondellea gigas TaxID=1518452 RepID=A0A6A7FM14_9CRUS